ncbi:Tim44 domain-containing protein [Azonexus sp.]|uniref:Tim44 domain-containing protein n=1 Tax=Azonexus sp. TaxID=1872668 RepID=UPI0039E63A52
MNKFFALVAAVVVGFTLNIGDAEAKRLGGGGSFGMKRQMTPPAKNTAQQAPQKQQAGTPAQQAQPKRSWMGPLAGLAAGLGLAALASHLGFGEEMANIMMIALLAIAALMLFRYFTRNKNAPAQGLQNGLQYAGARPGGSAAARPEFTPAAGGASGAVAGNSGTTPGTIPADFDAAAFVRNAKLNFIRLQAANDAGNLNDIREFTSPEVFAEIKLAIDERQGATQETDVVHLDAEVLDVTEEAQRYIVSVHFSGQIREERGGPVADFAEVWHMTKPVDGGQGWVIAGIEQA